MSAELSQLLGKVLASGLMADRVRSKGISFQTAFEDRTESAETLEDLSVEDQTFVAAAIASGHAFGTSR